MYSSDEEEEIDLQTNVWATAPPKPPPRTGSLKHHLNPTPQVDPTDEFYREELIQQVLTLEQMLKEELIKNYHAQAAHRNQVRDNRTLKEYVGNLLQSTKRLDSFTSMTNTRR